VGLLSEGRLGFAYALYAGDNRVASFADGRIGYREWVRRTGRLTPAVEDKYLPDEDE
jgi:hypothetical protein